MFTMARREITLQDIANLIASQNRRLGRLERRIEKSQRQVDDRIERLEAHFEQADARFDNIRRGISEVTIEQIKLTKLYDQIFNRVIGIENDITEIYDRIVLIEDKLPDLYDDEYVETQIRVEKLYYWAHKVSLQAKLLAPE